MHYYHGGSGLITITASPALQQALGMDDDTDRILFAWQAGEQDSLTIPSASMFRRDLIQLDPESMSLSRDGDDLVLTLGDGTRAVFRRQ